MPFNHFEANNAGAGNCMYYAYSISLMYYLRAKEDCSNISKVFAKFALDEKQCDALYDILMPGPAKNSLFSDKQINTIETILGPATRSYAANQVILDYKKNIYESSTYPAANYGMEYYIRKALKDHRISSLMPHNDFSDEDYKDSELYQVPGLKSRMQAFVSQYKQKLTEKFDSYCQDEKLDIQESDSEEQKTEKLKRQQLIVDKIVAQMTERFFKENDEENLQAYQAHLAQNYCWGTEETLMALHRGLMGEK